MHSYELFGVGVLIRCLVSYGASKDLGVQRVRVAS